MIFIMVKPNAILNLEPKGIKALNGEKGKKPIKKVQCLIILSIRAIMQVLMILKPLPKSVMNLDTSSEKDF